MRKVLVANRGEIAVRVIRALRELGIKTVAIHSTADRDSLHAKIADESICIGPPSSLESYLKIPAVMSAVEVSGADGIHPGYGFLSENAEFARIAAAYKVTFIGPRPEHIESLGNKVKARDIAKQVGVPLLPGSDGVVQSVDELKDLAKRIGFPLIIKAAAGGGGRGMKVVSREEDLERLYLVARNEALTGFGSPDCFVERYCQKPRHIEIQIVGDRFGTLVHLGERDCSVQRRHQKVVEEAPSPAVSPVIRQKMGEAALKLARHVGYESLGTVEFLLDQSGAFYFMEVNTRVQVEHTVTEEVTGIDLVKEQIRIADGHPLSFKAEDVRFNGHSIQCRINAEDPNSFAPWPGKITAYHEPGGPGIRLDSMAYDGYTVPPHYDSLVAKLISHGRTRDEALQRMKRALSEMKVDGIRTNIAFHERLLATPEFMSGATHTGLLEELAKKGS